MEEDDQKNMNSLVMIGDWNCEKRSEEIDQILNENKDFRPLIEKSIINPTEELKAEN